MGETATVAGLRQLERGAVVDRSDDELVAGVRAGVPVAFEEIYDRYARGILAFCTHMLGSRDAAEDALQLTFVSAYRALRSGESSIALRPWLYTIARNRCLSELRARRDAIGVTELDGDHAAVEGLADQVQRREDLREMLDDMQRLPADQRAALVLFELGDHPQKEIASVLGVRTEKVKALVFQAREALVRGRQARQHACGDIREQLATMKGGVPARGLLRAHIDRCPGCQSFEYEVRDQRAAFALILPVALAGELKTSVLGSVLHGGGAVAAACGGGGGAIVGGATAVGGGSAIGGAGAAGGLGAGALSATAGGLAGAGAVVSSAPVVAAATGLTALGESVGAGVGGLSASGVMAKLLTAAAIATVAAGANHATTRSPLHRPAARPTTSESVLASLPARPAARTVLGPALTPVTSRSASPAPSPGTVTSTPAGSAPPPSSSTPMPSGSGTSTPTTLGTGSGGSASPTGAGTGGSGAPPASSGGDANSGPPATTSAPPAGSGPGAAGETPPAGSEPTPAPPPTGSAASPDTSGATDPSSATETSGSPPADAAPATSSTGASPPAPDASPTDAATPDAGSGSSSPSDTSASSAGDLAGPPATPPVDQPPPSTAVESNAIATEVGVSPAASPPAQDDAAAAPA
jgi:RNA polymerase sigma factor (sigma-70 family)